MRFKDLSPEAVECLWDRWKYSIERVLHDFNEDVFSGSGNIRENSYCERFYLSLQTKKHCVYVFPIPGNRLVVGIFRGKIEKGYLSLKSKSPTLDRENLIGWFALPMDIVDERYETSEEKFWCLEQALKILYSRHWPGLSF